MRTTTRILKAAAPLPARRVEGAVFEADRRVREMVAAAEEEARRIVADAASSRARALADAAQAGRAEAQAGAAGLLARAAVERDRLLRDAEREVVRLALAVARKILGRELAASPDTVVELAAAGLAEARARREVVLRVSPADAAVIRAAEGKLAAILLRAPLRVQEDPAVAPGGAVVETEAGRIDAGIECQLAAVARAVEEALA